MYTLYQLKQYANKFLMDNYGMKLTVPLELNGRLKRSCGRFISERISIGKKVISETAKSVQLNKFFVENNEPNVVLDVLRHELVHYVLFMQGKPNSDGHPVFERELRRLGIVSQGTIDKYNIESKKVKRSVSVYKCIMPTCGRKYQTGRKLKHDGMFHKCHCGGKLQSLGKKVVQMA